MGARDQELINSALEMINKHRADHGVPPMEIDETLNEEAQDYADYQHNNKISRHSMDPLDKYGEVLAHKASSQPKLEGKAAADWAVGAWYGEEKDFDFDSPGSGSITKWGHFSAMIWKSSTKMGIGIAHGTKVSAKTGSTMNEVWVVGRFLPPGNMLTPEAMKENVPKRK